MAMTMTQKILAAHAGLESVKAGQLLGYVGNTGSSTGPHLHYGMSNSTNGAVLNPRSYLPLDEKGFGKCYNYR